MAKKPNLLDQLSTMNLDEAVKASSPTDAPAAGRKRRASHVATLMSGEDLVKPGRQRKRHTLPASKTEIDLDLMDLDPALTFASPLNPRCQDLMTPDDPLINAIKESMHNHTQQEPVYARPVKIDGVVRYEVFVGTTRRYCAELLNRELEGGYALKAWVGDVGDGDASLMAREENERRRDISTYEKALDLADRAKAVGLGRISQNEVAGKLGINRGLFSRYLRVADLDQAFAAMLESPGLLTLRPALQIHGLIEDLTKADRERLIKQMNEEMGGQRFKDAPSLIKKLKSVVRASDDTVKPVTEEAVRSIEARGKVVARLVPSSKPGGKSRIELNGVDPKKLDAIMKYLEGVLTKD